MPHASTGRSARAAARRSPGTLRLRAPLQPGRFTLTVTANGQQCACGRLRPEHDTVSWAAQAGSVIGCAGLALLFVADRRRFRVAGLVAWAARPRRARRLSRARREHRRSSPLPPSPVSSSRQREPGRCCAPRTCSHSRRSPACRCGFRFSSATRTPTCCCRSTSSSARSRSHSAWQLVVRRDEPHRELGPVAVPLAALRRLDRPDAPVGGRPA